MKKSDIITGSLIGTAVGDALGLAYEGLSRSRAKKLYGLPERYHFFFGRGMISDDTEHTYMLMLSFDESQGDPAKFGQAFARRLKWWFWGLPAGIGIATAKACLKLTIGFSYRTSGVFSAGNGAAMRCSILGVLCDDLEQLKLFNRIQTRITHVDPKAEYASFTIALAAFLAKSQHEVNPDEYLVCLKQHLPAEATEYLPLIEEVIISVKSKQSLQDYLISRGLSQKISGYVYHCVPPVIHCWLSHQHHYQLALQEIISCGGDTDTNAAMLGGIIGANVGPKGIPQSWQEKILDWPLNINKMNSVGDLFSSDHKTIPFKMNYPWWIFSFPRNLIFLLIVLFHGFRRLLPPY